MYHCTCTTLTKWSNATIFHDLVLLQKFKFNQDLNAIVSTGNEWKKRQNLKQLEVFLCSQPVKIKLCAQPWLLAQRHIKLMDQRTGAQHMKPIYFKGQLRRLCCSTDTCTQRHAHTYAHNIKLKEACVRVGEIFYIQPTCGTTETVENSQSIIIRREE